MKIILAAIATATVIVLIALNVLARRRLQRFVGSILLAASCFGAIWGWYEYQWNLEAFQRSFSGGTAADFESIESFVTKLKLGTGQSLVFNVGKDGKARPGTLWQVGESDFVAAIVFLPFGFWLLFRHGGAECQTWSSVLRVARPPRFALPS